MKQTNPLLEVRSAVNSDIPAIQEIAQETWPVTYNRIIPSRQVDYMLDQRYSTDVLEEDMFLGHSYIIAELNGTAIGFACYKFKEERIYKLDKLYVNPKAQKVGAGMKLLQEVIKRVIESGGKEIILQVNRKNKSVGFYQKMGFEIVREQDFHIGDGYYMNDYVMSLLVNN